MGNVHLIIVYVPGVGLVVSKARGVKFAVSFFWVSGHIEIYPVLWWTLELRFYFTNLPYNMPYSVNADTQGIRIPLNADPRSKNTFNADKSGYYLFIVFICYYIVNIVVFEWRQAITKQVFQLCWQLKSIHLNSLYCQVVLPHIKCCIYIFVLFFPLSLGSSWYGSGTCWCWTPTSLSVLNTSSKKLL